MLGVFIPFGFEARKGGGNFARFAGGPFALRHARVPASGSPSSSTAKTVPLEADSLMRFDQVRAIEIEVLLLDHSEVADIFFQRLQEGRCLTDDD